MYTFKGPKGTVFHFNGDFSGDIIVPGLRREDQEGTIPAEDLLALVAYHYVLPARMDRLEQASAEELLLGAGAKPKGADDMLDEYDIRGGQRGKYVARYTVGVEVLPTPEPSGTRKP